MEIANWSDKDIREARAKLWNDGYVLWKLGVTQRKIYDFFHEKNKDKIIVVNASRRLGKSFLLLTLALEQCLKYPKSIVKLVQPTQAMIRVNLNPDFETMIEDCPLEIRPSWDGKDSMWKFPNGSKIHVAGTDGKNYDKLRGGNADLCLVDEAGFCSDLKHVITKILTPLTLRTKGRIIIASTTPYEPEHEFIKYMEAAEINGTLIRKTIWDAVEDNRNEPKSPASIIDDNFVHDLLKSYPTGEKDQAWRTEFLCEVIFNSDDSVLPEFTQQVQNFNIVNWVRPTFFDRYTAMDVGFVDLTAILFGYWDYVNSVLVIEDEYVGNGPQLTTSALAKHIKDKEKLLWKNKTTGEIPDIYKRVSDNNLQVINDLNIEHSLFFQATEKHNKLEYMSILREMVANNQIKINPKCKNLISHMRSATWDKSKKDFKRSTVDGGHFDCVAALLYLSRNIDKTRNPFPKGYRHSHLGSPGEVFAREFSNEPENTAYDKLAAQFQVKSSFKRKK